MIKTVTYLYKHLEECFCFFITLGMAKQNIIMQVNWPDKIAGGCISIAAALFGAFIVSLLKKLFPNFFDNLINFIKSKK